MTQGEHWIQNKWRPITAVVYLIICVFDFIIFPVLWSFFLHYIEAADKSVAWDPLTLKGAGLFHLAFGAILGVSAYTRGQEKIQRFGRPLPERYDDGSRYVDEYRQEEHYDPPIRQRPRFEPPIR